MSDMIWKTLQCLPNGHIPRVKRKYQFTGTVHGQKCNFPVELVSPHPRMTCLYKARAVFAHNCWFVPDWVNAADLTEIP
jgi:hypothetical protein